MSSIQTDSAPSVNTCSERSCSLGNMNVLPCSLKHFLVEALLYDMSLPIAIRLQAQHVVPIRRLGCPTGKSYKSGNFYKYDAR